jgi:hypothetical protein
VKRISIALASLLVPTGFVAAQPTEPTAVTEPAAGPATGYDGGFFIDSADKRFALKIQARVQGRLTVESVDPGAGMDRENASAFSITRARLTLKGHAFAPNVKYKFQADFGKGNLSLKDFYVDYGIADAVVIRAGQYKRPFSRQQVNSSGKLAFVDRAITDDFDTGRDIGVMVHNNYEKSPEIEWAAGVFNGTGDKSIFSGEVDPMTGEVTGGFSNLPEEIQPALVARGGYNHGGIKGYSEADLEGGPLRFGAGGSVLLGLDNDEGDDSRVQAEIDAVVKRQGLSVSGALYLATDQDGTGFFDQAYSALGAHLQAGYVVAEMYQPAVRYAIIAPDGEDASHEISAAFSIYRFKHGFKWQSDVALLGTTSGITDEVAARTQLQLSF